MKTRSSIDTPGGIAAPAKAKPGEEEILTRGSDMYKESSTCLKLFHDDDGGRIEVGDTRKRFSGSDTPCTVDERACSAPLCTRTL
jgi:hypothetical protein